MFYKVWITEEVEYEKKGQIKTKKQRFVYITEAESVTEAEARTTKYHGKGDYEIKAVRQENIETVILKK